MVSAVQDTTKRLTNEPKYKITTKLSSAPSRTKISSHRFWRWQVDLFQNYPNPFNPETRIDYEIPVASHVTIKIFNILGQHVRTLVNEFKLAGNYSITWDRTDHFGNEILSGIYV